MPKKLRELKAMLSRAGFVMRPGKGDHTVWTHPQHKTSRVTLAGNDGDDAPRYQEKAAIQAIRQTGGNP